MNANKRPPNIVIASSNTAEFAGAGGQQQQQQQSGDGTRTQSNSNRGDKDPGSAAPPLPSMAAVHSRTTLLRDSSASSDELSSSTPPQPTLIVHSATRTMPYVDFELAQSNPAQPVSSSGNGNTTKASIPALVIGPPTSGLVKRSNIADGSSGHQHHSSEEAPQRGSGTANTAVQAGGGGGSPQQHTSFEHEAKGIPHTVLTQNLSLFVLLKILGSFDSGAFSATLNGDNGITEDWGLSVAQQGTLSSSVFLGNMIGCAIAGHLFSIYSAKMLLFVSLIIHGFFTFLFASAETYEFALLCRFFIGVTLAFIVVYTPVWVDEFAPKSSAATWMAMQNAGVPLGIMLGFVIGGLMPTYTSVSWEWAFYFKTIVMVPIIALVGKTDRKTLDTSSRQATTRELAAGSRSTACGGGSSTLNSATTTNISSSPKHNDGSDSPSSVVEVSGGPASPRTPQESFRVAMYESYRRFHFIACRLLHNGVYISNMLSLSSLYFVVSGLQTFITSYLRADPFNASMETIVIGFGCAVVTAPVFGVVAGGVLLDRIGGYHGNILRASRFGLAWGCAAAVLSVVCVFIQSTMLFLTVVWFLLFCGGAIIPPGSGINMASLPVALRPSGSSVAQMAFNFLGNFSGPLLCGWISEWSGSLTWGVRAVFAMGVLGVVPMSLCTWFAARREKQDRAIADAAEAAAAAAQQGGGGGGGDGSGSRYGSHDRPDDDGEVLFSLPPPYHHHHAAANISIIGALEEVVEAAEESPRNEDEDVELMAISRLNSSMTQNSASFPRLQLLPSKSGTPIKRGSFGGGTPPLPQRISPGGGRGGGAASLLHPHHQMLDAAHGASIRDSPSLKAKSTPLRSYTSTPHQQHLKSSFAKEPVRSPHIAGHRPPSSIDPSSTGGGGGHPATSSGTTTPHTRLQRAKQQGVDDAEFDAVTMDSGQFNFSFPYQHTFGLDVVRGILNLDGSRTDSRQASRSAEGRSPSPVEAATQTQPLEAAVPAAADGGSTTWCERLDQNARRETGGAGGGEVEI